MGILWPGVAVALVFLAGVSRPGQAAVEIPSAVDLIYFRGEGGDGVAYLEWETGTESDTAGFRLERANSAGGPYSSLDDIGFILASGSVSAGAYYEATDETAVNGQTYWYKLLEYTEAGTVGDEWTVRVDVEPEPTAQIIGGGGATATATDTPVPTSTIRPTATDRPPTDTPTSVASASGNGSEPAATNTPRPTATGQPTRTPRSTAAPTGSNNTAATTRTLSITATPTNENSNVEALGEPASTPSDDAYPVMSEEETEEREVAANPVEAAEGEEETAVTGVRSVGSAANDEEMQAADDASVVRQEGESNSLLLWLGFIAAFLIFVGGVAFSIFLSTRKRDEEL